MNGQSSALHFDFNVRDNEVLLSILNLNINRKIGRATLDSALL